MRWGTLLSTLMLTHPKGGSGTGEKKGEEEEEEEEDVDDEVKVRRG